MLGLLTVMASRVAEHRLWGPCVSLVAARELQLPGSRAQALGRMGFPRCSTGAVAPWLQITGSTVVVPGLSCLQHVGSSQTRKCTRVSCITEQTPNPWTTKKTPLSSILKATKIEVLCLEYKDSLKFYLKAFFSGGKDP